MRSRLALSTLPRSVPFIPTETSPRLDVAALYRAHAPRVARWAAHLGGPHIEVDDVVQEVFLLARRKLPSFEGEAAKVTTWLFRVTEKIVQAARRRQRVRRWFGSRADDEIPGMGCAGLDPADALERRRKIQSVYTVLDTLPQSLRRVLILFEIDGLSTQAIAELVGIRLGTVRVRLHRARGRFLLEYQRRFLDRREATLGLVADLGDRERRGR